MGVVMCAYVGRPSTVSDAVIAARVLRRAMRPPYPRALFSNAAAWRLLGDYRSKEAATRARDAEEAKQAAMEPAGRRAALMRLWLAEMLEAPRVEFRDEKDRKAWLKELGHAVRPFAFGLLCNKLVRQTKAALLPGWGRDTARHAAWRSAA